MGLGPAARTSGLTREGDLELISADEATFTSLGEAWLTRVA